MLNPRIEINLAEIENNTKKIVELASNRGIDIWAVTKGATADLKVAKAMLAGGAVGLADSRIRNLKGLKSLDCPLMLLRIPMLSEVNEVVEIVDISLNSELELIKRLNQVANSKGKVHKIILMVDLGDRREGILPEDLFEVAKVTKKLSNIELIGLGTNLACFRGILPNQDNMTQLMDLVNNIREELEIELPIISAGNSSSLPLLLDLKHTPVSNQLRVGETILLGREVPSGEKFELTSLATFKLIAELIELKEKPTASQGEQGNNAFGQKQEILDKGVRKRGILGIGRQDIDPNSLFPLNPKISIEGASSDHLIVDLSKVDNIKLGDEIEFRLGYGSLLHAMTSPYVEKVYHIEEE
ncbi:putative amino acid racemase [Orenia metallireducens]|uniref:Predicted amino acid racemase n=1 Tax=Orenia metallireducens TaxID=1413210 RepID=A0A285HA21_9FIRM|nr:alanine/ornithine racemase family PLP-dependent enzyme [Orenia metallireducens]PRX26239.1 putative amino acid racemase [Orenia metallireducens]SNY31696.1 Predicted amino acid racemase [Orenia metallireducens]